jgi:hypothetical protein
MCFGAVRERGGGVVDADLHQPSMHVAADAGDVGERHGKQRLRKILRAPDGEPVAVGAVAALAFLAGDLRQLAVCGEAGRCGDPGADVLGDRRLDPCGERLRIAAAVLIEHAGQLVDALGRVDGYAPPILRTGCKKIASSTALRGMIISDSPSHR